MHKINALILALSFLCSSVLLAQDAPNTVTITFPDLSEMRFHAVYLGLQNNQDCRFASREIQLGSYEKTSKYKEQLGKATISGGFAGQRKGKPDCLYYLGETEVRRSQWNSIMQWVDRREERALTAIDKPTFPQTEVTVAEVFNFIESLNSWMLQEQREQLPTFGGARAYCRLPTEAEWAFAARGGVDMLEYNQKLFKSRHPYGDNLGKYEWHRGNSNGQIQECGNTCLNPNNIGLRDMLGNVEELTISLFSPEYQRGRFGQFVVCGNNSADTAGIFSVFHRAEFASHTVDGRLRRPKNVGFRLVLTTSVSSSISGDILRMDREYQHYLLHPSWVYDNLHY